MNNEEAIKWLGNLINDIGQTRGMYLWPYAQALQEIITMLSDRNAAQQWISVKDRLPEEYGNYIAVVDGEATECTYSGPFTKGIITGWSTCEADGMKWLRDEQVTHWMPLPEPPKEDEPK